MDYNKKDKELKEAYKIWIDELYLAHPELIEAKALSNPYYISIPKGWYESDTRILVVGEEGAGEGGAGKNEGRSARDFHTIQIENWRYLARQIRKDDMEYDLYPGDWMPEYNRSCFWRRLRKLSQYGNCAWSNIDKLHILGESNCTLSEDDRNKLHSIKSRILAREIDILDPTHVMFFGWHETSLKHELPELSDELYYVEPGEEYKWFKSVVPIEHNGKWFIFSYHPTWGNFQKGYEQKVIDVFLNTLHKIEKY